jgi:hypothetical protein
MLRGQLELVILASLREGSRHGYAIIKELRERSRGELEILEGTLYPALHGLEQAGLIKSRRVKTGDPLAGSARDDRRLWITRPTTEHRDLQGFTSPNRVRDSRARDERVTGAKAGGRLRQTRQQNPPVCRMFFTGATGLEPATSGVTGRVRHNDARRRTPPNGLICRRFSLSGRPGFAWLSQSSHRRLGHEWATKCCQK